MSLCTVVERNHHELMLLKRLRRAGYGKPWMVQHDAEHVWRGRGEEAIRAEMERRLAEYFQRVKP